MMHLFMVVHVLLCFLPSVRGQKASSPSSPNTTFSDLFWQLSDLEGQRPRSNPYLGGQNFTWCCLKAFENALAVTDNGTVVIRNNSRSTIGAGSVVELQAAEKRNQFPCNAKYNGDRQGAPIVGIEYGFLVEQCPGWELSSKDNLNSWLHSLSGFLLPAVIFCLSVPRRRKLYIPRWLFVADLGGIKSIVPAILGAFGAGLIVMLDTTIWLAMCFALAGPMILGGLYEAVLDNRILEFLREKIQNQRLTLDMRCRCLMLILIGNLDLALEPESFPHHHGSGSTTQSLPLPATSSVNPGTTTDASSRRRDQRSQLSADALVVEPQSHPLTEMQLDLLAAQTGASGGAIVTTSSTQHDAAHQVRAMTTVVQRQNATPSPQSPTAASEAQTVRRRPTAQMAASPWRHMEVLLYDLRLYDGDDHVPGESPRQWARHRWHPCRDGQHCVDDQHVEPPRPWTLETEGHMARTKTRLRTMLQCQYSFGSVVGAPVIFFLGGFFFAFLLSLDNLGDEDIAESIAFGSWYMIIPHIAIVSGLLLAGNNPGILEGVFATERDAQVDADSATTRLLFGLVRFELAYPSCYRVAWQWLRGHNKKEWIDHLLRTYARRVDVDYTGQVDDDGDLEELRARTSLSPLDWFLVLSLTFLLLGVPFVLAFVTAFFTPQVGLSCRSLTFTVYFCLQVAQIGLWLWAYAGPPPALTHGEDDAAGFHPLNFFCRGGWLDRSGFYGTTSVDWLLRENGQRRTAWQVVRSWRQWLSFRGMWCGIYHVLVPLFGISAIVSSIGATLMQIMGVYRTAICHINVEHWVAPIDQRPMVVLSRNSEEMIGHAVVDWTPCAITAIVFMGCVSFVAWWYQRRMRDLFRQLVRKMDDRKFDRGDTKRARRQPNSLQFLAAHPGGPSAGINSLAAASSLQAAPAEESVRERRSGQSLA